MNPLQELIRRRMAEQGWSFADVARRGGLPRSTVHHLANNARPSRLPHPQTIARLAQGLDLPPEQVRAAAQEAADRTDATDRAAPAAAAPDPQFARLVDELGRLSPDDLRRVADFTRSLRDESEP